MGKDDTTLAALIVENESQGMLPERLSDGEIETSEQLTIEDGTDSVAEQTTESAEELQTEPRPETPVEKLVKLGAKRKDKMIDIEMSIENKLQLLEEFHNESIELKSAEDLFAKERSAHNSFKKNKELSLEELNVILKEGGGKRTVSSWEIQGFKLLSQLTVNEIAEIGLTDEDSVNMIVLNRDGKIIDRYGLSDDDLQLEIEWSRKEDAAIQKQVYLSEHESDPVPESETEIGETTIDETIQENISDENEDL